MKAIRTIASAALMALLATSELVPARDWNWYPRKAPADADVLRPDLEGAKPDAPDGGMSELEEMRQWLRRRDEDRRQQGITVPDTVEQLEPAGDVTARRRPWPESRVPGFDADRTLDSAIGSESTMDEQSERVRDTLFPNSYRKHHWHGSRKHGRRRQFSSSQRFWRHGTANSGKKRRSGRKRR